MNKLYIVVILLFGLTTMSCTSSDDSSNNNNGGTTNTFYKKSEAYVSGNLVFDKTVNYNSENKIQSIVTIDYGFRTETLTATYVGDVISTITETDDFDNPNSMDNSITYDVTIEDNLITLSSNDEVIEILHFNGYVNRTREYNPANPDVGVEQMFMRDANQNLISNTTGDGSTFTYTNFDSGKKVDPFGSVTEYFLSDYFKILGLKVTKNNPRTATYNQGNVIDTYSVFLEYDDEGFVVRSFIEENFTSNYTEHQYIVL